MNIYYLGIVGTYSFSASEIAKKNIDGEPELVGLPNFTDIWQKLKDGGVGVLPIENSYAGSIHQNFYGFLRNDFEIIGEIILDVNLCLLSNEKDISKIKKVCSHPQPLGQCSKYIKAHGFSTQEMGDTALSAKTLSETGEMGVGAIASKQAGEAYGLNILEECIQDQKGNSTRFFVVKNKEQKIKYLKKAGKISILFKSKNIPAALYKCLGGFATNGINLSKIESLPAHGDPFNYMFWIDFEGNLENQNVKNALDELKFFSNDFKILGEY